MASDTLQFLFDPAPAEDAVNGWGRGCLLLAGEPYWYGEDQGTQGAMYFNWTWVDLLAFLGKHWQALCLEQAYPLPWIVDTVTHPGEVWDAAERRWALMCEDEETVEAEESVLLPFMSRHNLAEAWQGVSLPQLLWLRVGQKVWLVPESGKPLLADFKSSLLCLQQLGDCLANSMAGSTNLRVQQALMAWSQRAEGQVEERVSLATGWPSDVVSQIQGDQDARHFWLARGAAANDLSETEVLAAARMLRFTLAPEELSVLLGMIAALPKNDTPGLDQATAAYAPISLETEAPHAWEQGYRAATWLRTHLGFDVARVIDPEDILQRWGVPVQPTDLQADTLEALSCWGRCGPVILLNNRPGSKTSTANRRRTTLAHEIAHLLLDRHGGLPVAEVLGGQIDPFIEQRARAFAAEFLLPRQVARNEYRQSPDLPTALNRLAKRYRVSRRVAEYQLHNSGCALTASDEIALSERVSSY